MCSQEVTCMSSQNYYWSASEDFVAPAFAKTMSRNIFCTIKVLNMAGVGICDHMGRCNSVTVVNACCGVLRTRSRDYRSMEYDIQSVEAIL